MASGDYSAGYFSQKGGGYYVIENSNQEHSQEEIEAARIMADKGYKVKLKDEDGQVVTPDGYIFSASFEQRTPDGSSDSSKNILAALRHGRNKNADIAVIYQKYGKHSRKNIENAIAEFEQVSPYRFKMIFIITRDGRIHRHKHNDI